MSWQDAIFAGGSVVMSLSLLPTVRSPRKPAPATGIGYLVILLAFAIAYASLGLWLAATTTAGNDIVWAVIVAQTFNRITYGPRK